MYHVAWWWCTYAHQHQYVHDGGLVCGFVFIFQFDPPLTLTLTCLLLAIATLGRVLLLMNIIKDSNFEGGMAGMMHDDDGPRPLLCDCVRAQHNELARYIYMHSTEQRTSI